LPSSGDTPATPVAGNALIIGASRGLGLALATEYLARGWQVTATVRDSSPKQALEALRAQSAGALRIAPLEITDTGQLEALCGWLAGQRVDLLFVNAGVTDRRTDPIGAVSTEEFIRVMLTNALAPMRILERMTDRVDPSGCVAVMSSALASISGNTQGSWELYRASKAALNMMMRSFMTRRSEDPRTFLALSPGWVRTGLGGPEAPLDPAESARGLADVIARRWGSRGLRFVNYQDRVLDW
jgi:NAD(P)-dependent dehydrogenase (short-subunit alcohol dehydrogenase family)